jgi:DNA-directed RNA polymerase sigma subunit (sigma70/sigma32)
LRTDDIYGALRAQYGRNLTPVENAVYVLLRKLYAIPRFRKDVLKQQRNTIIRARFAEGATLENLAAEYNISVQRVHQIVHFRHR